jgi:predicted unusual protein kinase regulating ubiquinone biosynthesis (AarF/ABC1/UbiB family)
MLAETFADYGGVLSKISQMVNYAYGIHDSEVYSQCKPINEKKTKEFLESELLEFDDELISYETEVFKSGSVGQVHRAVFKDGRDIVIKVQYVGLKQIFDSDLFVLDSIVKFLFTDALINDAIGDIKRQLYEELDYRIEARNQTLLRDFWKDNDHIKIPKVIPELCNEKLLSMEYIPDAESLSEFLDSASKPEIKIIGDLIIRFMFENLFKYQLIYTDVHYGNFLIKDKRILYVLDFGSVNYVDDAIFQYLPTLLRSVYLQEKELFYGTMEKLGVITKERPLSEESKDYMWNYFQLQFCPWITEDEEFEFCEGWVDKCGSRNVSLMDEWVLPSNMIWLNKFCHGFTHIIGKMNFKGNYIKMFQDLGVYP